MFLSPLARFLRFSIPSKTSKISALHFSTSCSADIFCTHLQNKADNLEKSLNSVNVKLDSNCVRDVLNRYSKTNSLLGLRFFVWAGFQSNYRHTSYMYGEACRLFKIKQHPEVVLDLIEAYRVEKCVVNVKTFKVVLNLLKEARVATEALLVLKKMPEFDLRPDTNAYNVVIRLFSDKGDMDMAQKLMEEMGLIDLYPDMITYVSMIKGFCNVGRLEEACGLFKVMRMHGCAPNAVAYSTLLDGVCKSGSFERSLDLLEKMEKEGGDCNPNVVTYTSVIQALCEKGRTRDAIGVFDRMEAYGCAPNRVTMSYLIKGLCMDGHIDEAYKLIDRAVVQGGVSYGDCYSSLVVCLIRTKKVKEAENIFGRVLSSGLKLDSLACSLMIKELCSEKKVFDGYCLYVQLEKMGFLYSVDSDIYSVLLAGLCEQNHLVEAAKLAQSMLGKRVPLKATYVDKIVAHLRKYGDEQLVAELVGIRR
uniref:Pentatricopeptide repeat-containing protein At5g47360 n=1 Tax=Rhizophora mucronata TaxID=61149 RepID=A0A2P2MXL6_RHIMU